MQYQSETPFINVNLDANCLTIEFNRPDALNALRPEMLSEATRLVTQANEDARVKVIVLRGAGRAFSAGVDLKVLQGVKPQGGIIGNVFDKPAEELAAAIRDAGVPVIARAVGACFTGALEVALHCDFVYTTHTTKFGDTHTNLVFVLLGECRKRFHEQSARGVPESFPLPRVFSPALKRSSGGLLMQALRQKRP